MGRRLFSLAYAPVEGGKFFVVNGPNYQPPFYPVKGFIINIPKNVVEASFGDFDNPHDIAVNALGNVVYVVEYRPSRLHKFEIFCGNSKVSNRSLQADKRVAEKSSNVLGHVVLGIVVTIVILAIVTLVWQFGFKRKGYISGLDYLWYCLFCFFCRS